MQAIVITRFGGPDVLELADVPAPEPGPGELLVRVAAAGANRLDHYLREGNVNAELAFPHVPGSDACGMVEAIGEAVEGFALGDRVIPMPGYPLDAADDGAAVLSAAPSYAIRGVVAPGTHAAFMTVPARWTVRDTTGLSAAEVATLPMPLVTAVRALRGVGGVGEGDRVLMHAGASGTGTMLVQVARALGARVAATVRTAAKAAAVEALGAELVAIDDGTGASDARLRDWTGGAGFDVVVDNLGGPSLARSVALLRPLGTVVLMGNVLGLESTLPVRSVFFPQVRIAGSLMGDRRDLEWGLGAVADGRIRPILDEVFAPADAPAAHRRLADGAATGGIAFDFSGG